VEWDIAAQQTAVFRQGLEEAVPDLAVAVALLQAAILTV
jgi:hypothetical protein